jgi:hypothetical protein
MRRSVRCSCVRIPKALAFLRNGRYHIPASYRLSSTLSSTSPKQWTKKKKGERARKNNHFVIPFSYL